MARRDSPLMVSPAAIARRSAGRGVAGRLAALAILALVALALAGLVLAGRGGGASAATLTPYLLRITLGAAVQAALSTVLALALGTLLALALARRLSPRWRGPVLAALAIVTAAPALVIVFGLVAAHGRSGWLAGIWQAFGLTPPALYGLTGIVLAHVTLNAPFIARALLDALESHPGERWRLAASLGFSARDCFRHLDGPVLRREMPGLAALTFLLCFTSFAIVLLLGGGPANATLEVAIFEAIRVEADFARAGWLALIQMAIGVGFALMIAPLLRRPPEESAAGRAAPRPDRQATGPRLLDALAFLLAIALLAPPLLAALAGVYGLPLLLSADALRALFTSLAIALEAALIACVLALAMARAVTAGALSRHLGEQTALAMLTLPPMAFVTGLFVWARGLAHPEIIGLVLVPLVNGLMALPFAWRLIAPALQLAEERQGRLADAWGLTGRLRWRAVEAPALKRALPAAFALSAAFSLGDFGVVALFGGGDLVTLPALLSQALGAYRTGEAAALALLLLTLTGLMAFLAETWSSRDADA